MFDLKTEVRSYKSNQIKSNQILFEDTIISDKQDFKAGQPALRPIMSATEL